MTYLALFLSLFTSAQTTIPSGDVSGIWTKAGSPYNVTGDIRVSDNTSLIIQPGVHVIFHGHYSLTVDGTIRAAGLPGDEILFTVSDPTGFNNYFLPDGSWAGIDFLNNGINNDTSVFIHCQFSYSKAVDDEPLMGHWGGAILADNFSKLIIQNCLFSNNAANYGGAIAASGCSFSIIGCRFINNFAETGGAIMGQGTNISMFENEFRNNTAFSSGGAITCWGGSDFVASNNIIAYNSAQTGAGIWINASTMNAANNFITNNSASTSGGGIQSNTSYPKLVNNIICNNNRGGVILSSSDALIFNNTICNNSGSGGGIQFSHSNAQVINTIIRGNQSYDLYLQDGLSYPNFFNCVADPNRLTGSPFYGAWENVMNVNPGFINPTIGYGTAFDALSANWALQETSLCINAGISEVGPLFLPPQDIYGNLRISNRVIDIGAAETRIGVIGFSGQVTSDQTWFADTVKVTGYVQVNDDITLTINKGTVVQVQGPYAINVLGTLKAIGTESDMILFTCNPDSMESGWRGITFENNGSMNDNDSSIIQFCKIEYGKQSMGGGIRVYDFSKLLIQNSIFEHNEASYMGGAIYCNFCGPLIRNNTIIYNTAQRGGGIASDHAFPDIIGNTISFNEASDLADGIFLWFSNSRIEGNLISNHEVAIEGWGGNARQFILANNVIVQNLTGIILSDNPCYLINNTLCNNEFRNIIYRDGQLFVFNTIIRNGGIEIMGEQTRSIFKNCNIEGGIESVESNSVIPVESVGIIDQDPAFFRKINSAGPTYETFNSDWKILPVSPCIDKGNNEVEIFGLPDLDFMDNPRINNSVVDIGAVENQDGEPVIIEQPIGGIFCAGDSLTLFVFIKDTANYQWFKDGIEIQGAQQKTFKIDSLFYQNEGNYNCMVKNAYGNIMSGTVMIIVKTPPELVIAPDNEWVRKDDLHTLQVIVEGTPPIWFQWFKDGNPLPKGDKPELRFPSFDYPNEGTYYCRIENVCGTIMTDEATLYVAPQICMVTVDTVTGNNLVIWEKRSDVAPIIQYNVYREGIITGVFDKLASIPYDDLSLYLDEKADPTIQSYRYIITATDTAGNETDYELCRPHKTIHLLTTINPETRATQLDWDFYYGFNYGTFIVYRSTNETNFETFYQMAASSTTFTDPSINKELFYYRIGVLKPEPCIATSKLKADSGPYSHSMSNIEDNRFQTGIKELSTSGNLAIYPNPSSGQTTVSFPNPEQKKYQLVVRDLSGKMVLVTNNITDDKVIIEGGSLKSGYYSVEVVGDKIYRGKLVIE
jgi:predicted outer membrane repeat protein